MKGCVAKMSQGKGMATIRPALPCHVLPCPTGSPQGILQRQVSSQGRIRHQGQVARHEAISLPCLCGKFLLCWRGL